LIALLVGCSKFAATIIPGLFLCSSGWYTNNVIHDRKKSPISQSKKKKKKWFKKKKKTRKRQRRTTTTATERIRNQHTSFSPGPIHQDLFQSFFSLFFRTTLLFFAGNLYHFI